MSVQKEKLQSRERNVCARQTSLSAIFLLNKITASIFQIIPYSFTDIWEPPIHVSDWLICYCGNLILYQKKRKHKFYDEKQQKKALSNIFLWTRHTDPWCNMLQTLERRRKHIGAIFSDEHTHPHSKTRPSNPASTEVLNEGVRSKLVYRVFLLFGINVKESRSPRNEIA